SEDDAPPAPPRPLVIKRWNLPTWQVAPDKSRGINVFIDPNGPWVVTQSSPPPNLGRFNQPPVQPISWNAPPAETSPQARVTGSGTYVKYAQGNGKLSPEIHEQTTDRKLLTLRDTAVRSACITPDGKRIIVLSPRSTYPAHDVIKIPSGETVHHPERPSK